MKDIDGESIFKTSRKSIHEPVQATAMKMNIEKSTKIGQLISVEELNEHDQILANQSTDIVRIGELRNIFIDEVRF